jgi:ABC-type multidrug transport system fused ATPase/permease subunit
MISKKEIELILRYVNYKYIIFGILLFEIVAETLGLLYPNILGRILDVITIQKSTRAFIYLSLAYIIVFAVEKLLFLLSTSIKVKMEEQLTINMKKGILEKLFSQRTTDEEYAANMLLRGPANVYAVYNALLEILKAVVKIILILVIIVRIDWRICLGAVILIPGITVLTEKASKAVKKQGTIRQEKYQGFLNWIIDVTEGIATVNKYKMVDGIKKHTGQVEKEYQEQQKLFEYSLLKMEFSTQLMLQFLNYFIYFLSVYLISRGRLTLGSYVMIFEYYYIIQSSLTQAGVSLEQISEKGSLLKQAVNLLGEEREEQEGEIDGIDGSVECKEVCFSYSGEKRILNECSFRINAGEDVVVVAGSGAGKSTLMKLIAGIYKAEQGQTILGKHEINKYNLKYLRSQVGLIVQERLLLDDTVKENITLGRSVNEESIWRVLELAGFKECNQSIASKAGDGYQ